MIELVCLLALSKLKINTFGCYYWLDKLPSCFLYVLQIIRVLVTLALEQKPANREKASVLISDLYGQVLNSREVANGFDLILQQLEDLLLDTPDVTEAVGNFVARCVADDCLAPAYVTRPHPTLKDPRTL